MNRRHFIDRAAMIQTMERIVNREVKAYKTDWTDYDRPQLEALDTEKKACFYWITRDHGTYLIAADHFDSLRCVLECYDLDRIHARRVELGPAGYWMEKAEPADVLRMAKSELAKAARAA